MLPEFLSELPEELAVVKGLLTGAPVTFVTIFVAIIGAAWLILHFIFKNQLASKDATIAYLKGLLDYPTAEQKLTQSHDPVSTPAHNYSIALVLFSNTVLRSARARRSGSPEFSLLGVADR